MPVERRYSGSRSAVAEGSIKDVVRLATTEGDAADAASPSASGPDDVGGLTMLRVEKNKVAYRRV